MGAFNSYYAQRELKVQVYNSCVFPHKYLMDLNLRSLLILNFIKLGSELNLKAIPAMDGIFKDKFSCKVSSVLILHKAIATS
jgi:hypothetical protein